jgi:hypothetical protein
MVDVMELDDKLMAAGLLHLHIRAVVSFDVEFPHFEGLFPYGGGDEVIQRRPNVLWAVVYSIKLVEMLILEVGPFSTHMALE